MSCKREAIPGFGLCLALLDLPCLLAKKILSAPSCLTLFLPDVASKLSRDHIYVQVDVYEKASRVGGMTYTFWDTAPLVDHNVDKTNQVLCVRIWLSH